MARPFHQFVEVAAGGPLRDSKTGRATPREGDGLDPGLYFVLRRGAPGTAEFDHGARYIGPLASPEAAHLLETSAAYLGLIEPDGETERQTEDAQWFPRETGAFNRRRGTRPATPVARARAKHPVFPERPKSLTDTGSRAPPRAVEGDT
jgi:hypothetical protein